VTGLYADALRDLEDLSRLRLNIARQYSALTAAALQCLEDGDIEGFLARADKRAALTSRIDEATAAMETGMARLGPFYAAIARRMLAPGRKAACPAWCRALSSDQATLTKLLSNCLSMNARMETHTRALTAQMREQHTRAHAGRKLRSLYGAYAQPGALINYTSK
jgi:hypothetical protein